MASAQTMGTTRLPGTTFPSVTTVPSPNRPFRGFDAIDRRHYLSVAELETFYR